MSSLSMKSTQISKSDGQSPAVASQQPAYLRDCSALKRKREEETKKSPQPALAQPALASSARVVEVVNLPPDLIVGTDTLEWVGGDLEEFSFPVPIFDVKRLVSIMFHGDSIVRAPFICWGKKTILYEKSEMTFEQWLSDKPGPFRLCCPPGFIGPVVCRLTYPYADMIRRLLYLLEGLHYAGYTVDSKEISVKNFVINKDVLKVKDLVIKKSVDPSEIEADYRKLQRLIFTELLKGKLCMSPGFPLSGEVLDFLLRLDNPTGELDFISNHPALWTLEERVTFYGRYEDIYYDSHVKVHIITTLLKGLGDYCSWETIVTEARGNMPIKKFYGNKTRKELGPGLAKFLRDFSLHSALDSYNSTHYTLDDMENMIHALFPMILSQLVWVLVVAKSFSMLPRKPREPPDRPR